MSGTARKMKIYFARISIAVASHSHARLIAKRSFSAAAGNRDRPRPDLLYGTVVKVGDKVFDASQIIAEAAQFLISGPQQQNCGLTLSWHLAWHKRK
ncbi:hypothetical protein Aduo_001020 [Ancylostoma duodenale]